MKTITRRDLILLVALGAIHSAVVQPARAASPLTISAVAATNLATDRATIKWNTNIAATSQVEYGLTTSYGNVTPVDNTLVKLHSVPLMGLSPNTTYHYRVKSRPSPTGAQKVSADFTFKTLSPPPVAYRIQFWDYPNPGNVQWDLNNLGQVVGWYMRADGDVCGFLYDSVTDSTIDLDTIYGGPGTAVPDGWRVGPATGINDAGVLVGKLGVEGGGYTQGYILDTQGANQIELLPYLGPVGTTVTYLRINNNGDILTLYTYPNGTYGAYFYNYYSPVDTLETFPGTIKAFGGSAVSLNNPTAEHAAQTCGQLANGTPFLWTSGDGGGLQTFPGLSSPVVRDVNDAGVLCGEALTSWKKYPMRVSGAAPQFLTGALNHNGVSINSSGDVLLDGANRLLFHNELGYLNLDNLVTAADPDDLADWFSGPHKLWFLNDRDSTGFGQITGSIPLADGTNRPYILIPELPAP